MPSTNLRSVLVNLGVYVADNSVRRNVATFTGNFSSTTSNVSENHTTVNDGGSYTWNSVADPSVITIIVADQPLRVDVTPKTGPGYTLALKRMFLCDSPIESISLFNEGTLPAKLTIIQA